MVARINNVEESDRAIDNFDRTIAMILWLAVASIACIVGMFAFAK